jgi:hypothetical protein
VMADAIRRGDFGDSADRSAAHRRGRSACGARRGGG